MTTASSSPQLVGDAAGNADLSPRLQALVAGTCELLDRAVREYKDVVYSNSLGAEAMVLTDLIATHVPEIEIFTLDTGRLHEETLALLDRIERRYQRRIPVFSPDSAQIEQYVRENGINGFYLGLDERQSCCHIRKIEPFKRAIAGRKAWVTGVRREQSPERASNDSIAWDDRYDLWKVSPMLDWKEEDVWAYIKARNLPYNPLHDKGFPSIGCAPCTRAVEPGTDARSGRWWWESPESRECGLQPRRRVIPIKVESRRAAAQ
ncbi:phosphoadenylyl-sulfate reductase [Povalibacter sp.]|uniref:phosphoadenylyl-sulfate reductase n=1 Tax=Povalibacter sp. TaxID=1962978 RepID=UPI002F3EF6D0